MALSNNILGVTTGNGAEVDTNHNLLVNLPTNPLQAGSSQFAYVRDAAVARTARITEEGEAYSASARLLFFCDMNGSTILNNQFNSQATTMAGALSGGFLRLNSGAITTINTGIAYQTARTIPMEDGQAMRIKAKVRHANGAISNKQFDYGTGMYQVAAAQAGAMVEFIGYRWTQAGQLLGVVEYSVGGAPTSVTININGGVPLSDSITREYEILVTGQTAEFWINNVYQGAIPFPSDCPGLVKAGAYPILFRLFNGASAPALAPVFDIGDVSVIKLGPEADVPVSYRQVLMGRHSSYAQSGLTGTNGNTATNVASGTAPTATTGSNTAATITGLGGYFALNAAAATAANVNVIVSAYQNPGVVIAAGAATNSKNLIITDINIGALVVTTALTAGGCVLQWFATIGNTGVSQATTDAAGTTAIGSKSPRFIILGVTDVITAAATAGAVCARTGSSTLQFATPLVVHPGEYFSLGVKVIQFTAAATAGVLSGGVGVSGYWD